MLDDYLGGVTITRDHLPVEYLKGLYYDGNIIIDKSVDTKAELKCILAEELGHHHTSHGDILCYEENIKQENKARDWAIDKLVSLDDFIEIYETGCRSLYEAAEVLEITEEFLKQSIEYYKRKYGAFVEYKDYAIYFEPVGIMKRREDI